MRRVMLCLYSLVPLQSLAAPITWGDGNGHAYEVVLAPGITWSAAASAAAARGGHLASIGSSAENALVFALADGYAGAWRTVDGSIVGPWLGGTQAPGAAEPGGSWGWNTGEPLGYTQWQTGQPNDNRATAPGGDQNRMAFGNVRSGDWGDFQDNYGVNAYVVEYENGVRTRWNGNGHEYEVVRMANVTWDQAAARARSMGGHLVTIGSAAENAFVGSLIADLAPLWTSDEFGMHVGPWLGATQAAGAAEPGGGWTWIDDTGPFAYTHWNDGQPNDNRSCCTGGNQDRLHVYASNRADMTWGDYQGENGLRGFVVEYAPPVPEPGTIASLAAGIGVMSLALARARRTGATFRRS